jgi:integrase
MKFTKTTVSRLKPGPTRQWFDDDDLPGFRLVVSPNGRKTFHVRLRSGTRTERTERSITIGQFGILTLEQARAAAKDFLAQHRLGQTPPSRRKAPAKKTVGQLCDAFLAETTGKRKPKTVYEYRRLIEREIKPVFGAKAAVNLTRGEVGQWHSVIGRRAPHIANHAYRLLRTVFNWARRREYIPESVQPTKGIDQFRESPNERYLLDAELRRLGEVLANEVSGLGRGRSSATSIAAIRFLMLSGWRTSEVLSLSWSTIDWDRKLVELADTKTGKSNRQLGDGALAWLRSIPRVEGSPWVFPGEDPARHLTTLKHPWQRIRRLAGLDDVRLHDLRHTFASVAMTARLTVSELGKLLGHRNLRSTQRYAHLGDEAARRAADTVSGIIGDLIQTV